MITTEAQLKRYRKHIKAIERKELVISILKVTGVVLAFVILCDIAYRLSFII